MWWIVASPKEVAIETDDNLNISAWPKLIPPCFTQSAKEVTSLVEPVFKVFDLEPTVDLFTVASILIFAFA